MNQQVDLIIKARYLLPIRPQHRVLEHQAVVIDQGVILEVLPVSDLGQRYEARQLLTLPSHVLMPGLINAHAHSAMSLMRGIGDDMPLMPWLEQKIWPVESRLVSDQSVRDGTRLAIGEMIRGGTTCCNDMYFFPDAAAHTYADAGFRAVVGTPVIDFPTAWAADIDSYISRGIEFAQSLSTQPLISASWSPHAPYTVSDASFEKMRQAQEQVDLRIEIHLHESAAELQPSIDAFGVRPIERLDRLGLLNEHLMAVHMTAVTDAEIQRVAERSVHVLHCPESNLKLASGYCPVERYRQAGVNVALGTDGAASNNDLDLMGEMKTAALIGKTVAEDATAVPAAYALEMATINGAHALGLSDQTGSIEAGKQADLIAIDLDYLETLPMYDLMSHLVYSASRWQVSHSWVAGRCLMNDRQLQTLDLEELKATARTYQQSIEEMIDA